MAGTSKEERALHDSACTSCRTRKIRCGREKPRCSCCCRDQTECVYSSAPKRVNHIKVLCERFEDVRDRMVMMQGELAWLTASLKRSSVPSRLEFDFQKDLSADVPSSPHTGDFGITPITAGHVIRDDGTQIERYYGPWTLVALCRDFESDLASHLGGSNDEVVRGLVNKMLLSTARSDDDNLDLGTRPGHLNSDISLPQKQLLSVMLETYLKQVDYSTDIFCRETIYGAVERVYREPLDPTSEPWALCFNLIILLTLGTENPIHSEDPFVRPILEAAHATARNPSFFTAPRLVNVQALALFSLLAQQHHTVNETLSDFIFAQACTLARESGLHQANNSLAQSSKLSAVETEERQRVFRSLYIRDRFSATACGAITWLPNPSSKNWSLPPTPNVYAEDGIPVKQLEIQHTAHWELAEIQDVLHRLLSSADASDMSTAKWRTALARLEQKLEIWTQTHKVVSLSQPATVEEVLLHLALLGTRIRVLGIDKNNGGATRHISSQVLHDSRLSCLLVATSCNQYLNQPLVDRLNSLLNKTESTSSTSSPASASSRSSLDSYPATEALQRTGALNPRPGSRTLGDAPVSAPLPLHRLASVFPTAAVFVLARHILGIDTDPQSSQSAATGAQRNPQRQREMNQDISLLETLLFCFRSAPPPTTAAAARSKAESNTHGSKLGRIIQHLVDIIHAIAVPTSDGAADEPDEDEEDGEDDDEVDDVYVPDSLLTPTASMLLSTSNALSMPNLNMYGSGGISPSHFGLPPTSSTSASRSAWATPQGPSSTSATPLLTTGSSLYTPSTPGTIPQGYSDIAQFLHRMDASNPLIWDDVQGLGELEMQQQQQQQQQGQIVPETGGKQAKKRRRTAGNKDHGVQ